MYTGRNQECDKIGTVVENHLLNKLQQSSVLLLSCQLHDGLKLLRGVKDRQMSTRGGSFELKLGTLLCATTLQFLALLEAMHLVTLFE
jgi:hypothetical protein